jgi:hypothetical protein
MAATKSTKKTKTTKAVKTTSKASAASKKATAAKKAPAAAKAKKTKKTEKPAKKTSAVKTSKTKGPKKTASKKNLASSFFADVVKQATKAQKAIQSQTKTFIKELNSQDKQLSQLSKKLVKAKGKAAQSLDTKIAKLQGQMSTTRSELLASENNADKVATLIEWTNQLSSKPSVTAFMQTSTKAAAPSKPTLVKSSKSNTSSKKPAMSPSEEYAEETEDLDFDFGDDEDLDEGLGR